MNKREQKLERDKFAKGERPSDRSEHFRQYNKKLEGIYNTAFGDKKKEMTPPIRLKWRETSACLIILTLFDIISVSLDISPDERHG